MVSLPEKISGRGPIPEEINHSLDYTHLGSNVIAK
jgi:hypothetical protein